MTIRNYNTNDGNTEWQYRMAIQNDSNTEWQYTMTVIQIDNTKWL